MEGFITITGLCITFIPLIQFCNYLLNHVVKKTKFDIHLTMLRIDNKFMIFLAYLERILYGIAVSSFGFWMSELFDNHIGCIIFVLSLIMYVIVKYFDYKNEVQ